MRGVFTCGVLDVLMKHNLYFHYVVGVSAGACNGLSYMSHQPGRAKMSNIDMLAKYDYIGIKHLIKTGCIFDQELLYDKFPNEIIPYDYDAYFKSQDVFEMVVTNIRTGRAEYLTEKNDRHRLIDICRASSSLPYVSKMATVDGNLYLDGGLVDSIPVQHAMDAGHERNIVVLTRNRGYRKTEKDIKIPHFIYKNYPRLRVLLSRRCAVYNEQLEYVEKLEDEGRIIVVRPKHPLQVDRIEKDVNKLQSLYEEGLAEGEEFIRSIEMNG